VPLHRVTRAIEFCYGHRLLDYEGKCRHLHGHNGLLEVDVDADDLDELGMVVDFGDVRDLVKGWVDLNIDHRMVLWRRDPLAAVLIEMGEPVYVLDENPTAENLARHIFLRVSERGLRLSEVRLWETPSSCATYRGG
jgi:6-pyruvoyltetrahydropterin/6-carboxytetrahydropterin synthase